MLHMSQSMAVGSVEVEAAVGSVGEL